MLRKLRKAIKGQSTAEYAILIALVVAAVIAMQTFAKRALQARIKGAAEYLRDETSDNLGLELQYEPYYLSSTFDIDRDQEQTTVMTNAQMGGVGYESSATIEREGFQESAYDPTTTVDDGME